MGRSSLVWYRWGGTAALIGLLLISCRSEPTELQVKATPYTTHTNMLVVDITARRLASPTIDGMRVLEQGRLSSPVPGSGQLRLLAPDRGELFVLEFEPVYAVTGSDILRDSVLLTFVVPYSKDIDVVRVETPQGSAEVILSEVVTAPAAP